MAIWNAGYGVGFGPIEGQIMCAAFDMQKE